MCTEIECLIEARDQVESILDFPHGSRERDWYFQYQALEIESCTRAELVNLLASAPTDYVAGLVAGKFQMRLAIESITGRPFN
jgi:hypothetical protein